MSRTWFGRKKAAGILAAGIPILALVVSGCSSSGTGSGGSNGSITIGVSANLTGTDAAWDLPTSRAFAEHISEINKAGGVDGKQIKLITLNANSDEPTAISNAKKLIYQDNVLGFYGFGDTLQANAGLELTASAKVPTLATSWGTDNLTSPYTFQLSNNLTFGSNVLIKYLASHYKTIAITAETTSRGDEEVSSQKQIVKQAGFTGNVAVIRYAPDTTNFTPMISQLKKAKPEIILNNGASAADVTAPMKAAQAAGLNTPWAGITMAIPNVINVGGSALLNGSLTAIFVDYSKPAVTKLATLVKQKWHDSINYGYVQGWDAATLFAAALAKPNATKSRSDLRDAMESLKNVPVVGGPAGYTISFSKGTGEAHAGYLQSAVTVQQYQSNGSLAPAK